MPAAYAHAHYLWYAFAGVGALSLVAMLVFIVVTRAARREAGSGAGLGGSRRTAASPGGASSRIREFTRSAA